MPELPSVETFKKYFDNTSLHKPIKEVKITNPEVLVNVSSAEMTRSLKGSEFTGSYRYGKYLFGKLDNDIFLIIHFGMTGFLHYGNSEKISKHPRMTIYFSSGNHLTFDDTRKFGKLSITSHPAEFIKMKKLGPDALNINLKEFQEIFRGRKGMIKPLLMNQNVIAGIGNLYCDEILYQSGIHPLTRADQLDESKWETIYQNTRKVLKKAIEYHDKLQSLPPSYLLPHRHPGGQCPEGGDLEVIKVGGRTTYLCPNMQKIK